VLIYCIASTHGHCNYEWHRFGKDDKYPSTPVIYIIEAGLYQCTATMGSQSVRGNVVNVSVSIG